MTLKKVVDSFAWEVTVPLLDTTGMQHGFEEVTGEVVVYAGDTEDGDYDWDFFEGERSRKGEMSEDDAEGICVEIESRQLERAEEEEQGPPPESAA